MSRLAKELGIDYPIFLAGMSLVSRVHLAAAVAKAGGLGQICSARMTPDQLKSEIDMFRQLTGNMPLAVNIPMVYGSSIEKSNVFESMLEVVINNKVSAVTLSAGKPDEDIYRRLHQAGIKILQVISSARQAYHAENTGADAVIAHGFEAGGHGGVSEISNSVLIPKVCETVSIPVIAAGGVCDGKSYLACRILGADAVQIGTAFIASEESRVHENYKLAILVANEDNTEVIKRSIRKNARVLKNGLTSKILEVEKQNSLDALLPLISGERNASAVINGDLEEGYVYVGSVAGRITKVRTVEQIIKSIINEAEEITKNLKH